jgi:hypothetical protein
MNGITNEDKTHYEILCEIECVLLCNLIVRCGCESVISKWSFYLNQPFSFEWVMASIRFFTSSLSRMVEM